MLYRALIFAAAPQPLFGNVWLALLVVLAGIAVFLAIVAGFGRLLAATHPDAPPAAVGIATDEAPEEDTLAPDVVAVIAAAVTASLGARVRIASVRLAHGPAPTVEALMQQWSLEGRRQIYGSHKVR